MDANEGRSRYLKRVKQAYAESQMNEVSEMGEYLQENDMLINTISGSTLGGNSSVGGSTPTEPSRGPISPIKDVLGQYNKADILNDKGYIKITGADISKASSIETSMLSLPESIRDIRLARVYNGRIILPCRSEESNAYQKNCKYLIETLGGPKASGICQMLDDSKFNISSGVSANPKNPEGPWLRKDFIVCLNLLSLIACFELNLNKLTIGSAYRSGEYNGSVYQGSGKVETKASAHIGAIAVDISCSSKEQAIELCHIAWRLNFGLVYFGRDGGWFVHVDCGGRRTYDGGHGKYIGPSGKY
jgi:hypothetical protein